MKPRTWRKSFKFGEFYQIRTTKYVLILHRCAEEDTKLTLEALNILTSMAMSTTLRYALNLISCAQVNCLFNVTMFKFYSLYLNGPGCSSKTQSTKRHCRRGRLKTMLHIFLGRETQCPVGGRGYCWLSGRRRGRGTTSRCQQDGGVGISSWTSSHTIPLDVDV